MRVCGQSEAVVVSNLRDGSLCDFRPGDGYGKAGKHGTQGSRDSRSDGGGVPQRSGRTLGRKRTRRLHGQTANVLAGDADRDRFTVAAE